MRRHSHHLPRLLGAISVAAMLAACASGPDFVRPQIGQLTNKPQQYTASNPQAGVNAQQFLFGQATPQQWWRLYGSDKLNKLVEMALAQNADIDAAKAALRQAQASYESVAAQIYPNVSAGVSASRTRNSEIAGSMKVPVTEYNIYGANVSFSWGIDLFGAVRRAAEAGQARVDFQRYQLQVVRTSLAANVVSAAVREASLRAQLASAKQQVELAQQQLQLVELRQKHGAANALEYQAALSAVASANAALGPLQAQLSATQNQQAIYLGIAPADYQAQAIELSELRLPKEIAVSLPSELLQTRPDILAAEALLHQASANIGLASANMYPNVALSASFGTQAYQLANLFAGNFWNVAASLSQSLFDAGQKSAQRDAAVAAFEQAQAQYKQTVLAAFASVANGLSALQQNAQVLQLQNQVLQASEKNLQLTQRQFEVGAVAKSAVLLSKANAEHARAAYALALASQLADTSVLFATLATDPNTAVASK